MIESALQILQLLIVPIIGIGLTLWAGWLALAGEAGDDLPRVLAIQLPPDPGEPSTARGLHVAHMALLVLAGAFAAISAAWWTTPPLTAALRLLLAVFLVWILGDGLPRLLSIITPDLPERVYRGAVKTLVPFRPLFRLVNWADQKGRPSEADPTRRKEEGATRRDMLLGLFSLADTTLAEVMTPRIDIVAVDVAASRDEVIATLRGSEHARILVYDEHPDALSGVLYAKDMLASLATDSDEPWHTLIRPAAFVPEGKTLERQMRDFQRGPSHIAVVVDEYGGTAGIVTLEDILEQIVGEIHDEHDTDEVQAIQEAPDSRLVVEGSTALAEMEAVLGHSFNREDVSTVGGLILALFGRVPRPGETVELDGYRFVADQVVRRRVRQIQVLRPAAGAVPGPMSKS